MQIFIFLDSLKVLFHKYLYILKLNTISFDIYFINHLFIKYIKFTYNLNNTIYFQNVYLQRNQNIFETEILSEERIFTFIYSYMQLFLKYNYFSSTVSYILQKFFITKETLLIIRIIPAINKIMIWYKQLYCWYSGIAT